MRFRVKVQITEVAFRYVEAASKEDVVLFLEGEDVEGAEEIDFETLHDDEVILKIEPIEE